MAKRADVIGIEREVPLDRRRGANQAGLLAGAVAKRLIFLQGEDDVAVIVRSKRNARS